jgi:hypothetical protein
MSDYRYCRPDAQIQTRRTAPLVIGAPQIGLVLDQSASMESIQTEAIAGVNNLLAEQPADARFSLVLFNNRVSVVHEATPIRDVPALTPASYAPQGGTALNDGIGTMIQSIGKHASRLTPVLVAIVTDGDENSSQQFKTSDIRQMIAYRQGIHGWSFIFLGPASALNYARTIGIPTENCVGFTASAQGVTAILDRLKKAVAAFQLGDRNYALRLRDKS